MRYSPVIIFVVVTIVPNCTGFAAVTEYFNKSAWQTSIGNHSTLTFQGFPSLTIITNQYSDFGVLFSDGTDRILYNDSLLNDGVGLRSSDVVYGTIHLSFAQPMTAIAADFLGGIDILLYQSGQLIYDSSDFSAVSSRFGGLISSIPFDAAVIRDPSDSVVVIDDLFFGPAIPGPGTLGLFGLALLAGRRRRR